MRVMNEQRLEGLLVRTLNVLRYMDAAELEDFGFEREDADALTRMRDVDTNWSFVTRDNGLDVSFEDGSRWVLTISCYERPDPLEPSEDACPNCGGQMDVEADPEEGGVCSLCEREEEEARSRW